MNIVVVGASGHARVVTDIIERQGGARIVGIVDRGLPKGAEAFGYRVLGAEEDLPGLGVDGVVIAIGDNAIRSRVAGRIVELAPALRFLSAVHPAATVARSVSVGDGTVIMAGAIVNPGCTIGRHCILNTNASLDHDSVMEDFASLAPRAVTGGNCRIRSHAAVSIGATLLHRIEVGEHSVVGAGATVLSNVESYCVVYGTPAKVVRKRAAGDPYL